MTTTNERNNATAQETATTVAEKTAKLKMLDVETSFEPEEETEEKSFNLFSIKNVIRMIAFVLVALALLLTTLFSYNSFVQHKGETTVIVQLVKGS